MNISELSASQLRHAATIKDEMAKLQAELTSIFGGATPTPTVVVVPQKQKMSPAAKALLSTKLKAYWAKRKAAKTTKVAIAPKLASKTVPAVTPAPKKKWKISAAGMARIKAASKAYWAAKKAAKK